MNINEDIKKIKELQNLTSGYTEIAIENIKMAPFLFLDFISYAELWLSEDEIRIHLIRKNGIKSWFNKTFYKKEINRNLNLLAKYVYFWVPKTKTPPIINFYWGPIPDEHE